MMDFYKLGMLEALEKFAIKMTASDLPPFSGMMDPALQKSMNQETLDLYRKMTPEARKKLNPMEQMQVGNLSADPRFAGMKAKATIQEAGPSGAQPPPLPQKAGPSVAQPPPLPQRAGPPPLPQRTTPPPLPGARPPPLPRR